MAESKEYLIPDLAALEGLDLISAQLEHLREEVNSGHYYLSLYEIDTLRKIHSVTNKILLKE